ncbi:MAG: S24 family peptidase [Blastocatellia bacterium]
MTSETAMLLQASGMGRESEGIRDGDYFTVESPNGEVDGKTVVAQHNEEVFIRRCHLEGGMVKLEPMEGAGQEFIFPAEDVTIHYVVVNRIRLV